MGELTFSARELLFAGAHVGAKTFYGLPDPFYGMTQEEIRLEIESIQLALEKKGYAEVGFDDVFTLKPDVARIVETYAKCQGYLLAKTSRPGEKPETLLVYSGEHGLVEVDACSEELKLNWIEESTVIGRMFQKILPAATSEGTASRVAVTQADLAEIQRLAIDEPQKAIEISGGYGFSETPAAILIQGFRGEAGRYVFCKTDFLERTLTEMVLIQNEGGAVCMTLENAQEDLWNADYLPNGAAEEQLKELCTLKGVAHEVL